MDHQPRVLFFGMQGNFSVACLRALLESGIEVCAVVIPVQSDSMPGPLPIVRKAQPHHLRPALPMLNSTLHNTIVHMAWQRLLPVWEVSRLSALEVIGTLATYQADVICVACFSLRIPRAILAMPRLGCLNVHPSLLPALRGPEPLFWVFRQGLRQSGVSVHLMDEGMDTGDILAQERIEVPCGISYGYLEGRCAQLGGELLVQTVWALCRGEAIRIPQSAELSSYQSFPGSEEFLVPVAAWDAEHVYNFVRGVAGWAGAAPLALESGTQRLQVLQAISYSHEDTGYQPGEIYCHQSKTLSIQCRKGQVKVEVR